MTQQVGTKQHVFAKKLTIDQVNNGYEFAPGRAGFQIVLDDVKFTARGGNVGGATSVDIETMEGTPTKVFVALAAALTENAACRHGASNTTGTNIGELLAAGYGLRVIKAGSAVTTATHIHVMARYHYEV